MVLATLIEGKDTDRGQLVGLDELAAATRVIKRFVRQARPERCSGDQARQAVALLAEANGRPLRALPSSRRWWLRPVPMPKTGMAQLALGWRH